MSERWFDRACTAVALLLTVVFLFVPLFVIGTVLSLLHEDIQVGHHATEATVGIGVILRATARRLFRTGARNVMQTTVGAFSRTTARAITRRVVRVGVKSLTLVVKKQVVVTAEVDGEQAVEPPLAPGRGQPAWLALGLGFVALGLSLGTILWLVGPGRAALVLGVETTPAAAAAVVGQAAAPGLTADLGASASLLADERPALPLFVAALLGAVPLLIYALLIALAARWQGVEVRYTTALDGLLLQGYFTGGMSFLPLTTDVEYEGGRGSTAWIAGIALGGLFAVHLVLAGLGQLLHSPALQFASHLFLLYCFVYSFPIQPLDGQHLWARSKLLWLAFWVPILASFVVNLPEAFNAIL